ncbi:MAG TPA: hypothetical protein VFW33_10910 [Gemmataceae bacterium]|nr:hypothetical protein [Gemmataceae bacterium]
MRFWRRIPLWRLLPRRAGSLAVLLVYLAAATGFPVAPSSDSGSATRPCGCSAPDSCEGQCCCCKGGAKPRPCCAGKTASRWVIGVMAQQCRGVVSAWLALGAALPARPVVSRVVFEERDSRLALREEWAVSRPCAPPVPPPRTLPA